jgi:hypothetical protein
MLAKTPHRNSQTESRQTAVLTRQAPEALTPHASAGAARLLGLQQTHGNGHVQRMLKAAANTTTDEEECEPGTTAAPPLPQIHVPVSAFASAAKPSLIEVQLEPHRGTAAELRALAPVYKAGRTPYFDTEGTLRTFEATPADASTTAHQLGAIYQRYGKDGMAQTIRGLALTRGAPFASDVVRQAPPSTSAAFAATVDESGTDIVTPVAASHTLQAPSAPPARQEQVAGTEVGRVMQHSGPGSVVPSGVRRLITRLTGDRLTDVRVHNDASSHRAADLLNARAFTVGRSIYFGAGEYAPGTPGGRRLLAHELAHTVQQRGAELPAIASLRVSSSADAEEVAAENVADAVAGRAPLHARAGRAADRPLARLQRAISFKRDADTFTQNRLQVNENAAGFTVFRDTAPLFEWFANVTIRGNAGDPFANFEAGPHQVVRAFRGQFTWGTGASQAKRVLTVSTLPIRDATAAANTWYHDPFAQAFAANGDTKFTGLNDSPSPGQQPWTSPVAGKGGTTGSLAFTAAFVAYISARDTTKGTGAGAFTALNCLYWNSGISGSFDTSRAVGSRVTASGGNVNRGGIISGASGEFPSMHGGGIANDNFTTTDS